MCTSRPHGERLSKENRIEASLARAKANKTEARAKASLIRANTRARAKEKANNTARKGRMVFTTWVGHEDKQEPPTGQEYTEWTDTSWDHADNWIDAERWSSDRSTDWWTDPAWEPAARQLPTTRPPQEQSNPTLGGIISMSGG